MVCHQSKSNPKLLAAAPAVVAVTPPPLPLLVTASEKMAVPPTYADLGKSARDVFTKGYGFGLIKLDLKTKSENGLEFTSSGSLETKYRWPEYGLTFTEKWNTDNSLGTEITVEDQLTRYKRKHINLGCDVDFDIAGALIRGALVLGYEGWLSRVAQSNFAIGYKTDEFQLHTNVNNGKLETAVNLAWTAGNSNIRFGIAAKHQVGPDACFLAKVNNSSLIGIKLTLSALLDGKNVNAGGHMLGLGLEFQA
ncbi:LOC101841110 [Phodopus roborovskii]|uniref:Non-selective voltage-gated ion channel VDAC1 n=1 Tax=Phodopus roborovskii TaxID=109678 RepID=A0AAU9ZW16_PHORO|nr:LOC101841110 [Phodopus roborovskii]